MIGYVDVIKISVYSKLWPELAVEHDQEQSKQLSAAIVNRLFGSTASSIHADIPAQLVDELAIEFLRNENDGDVLNGIVMSLRTMMTIEANARSTEAMTRIADTVQWLKETISLPPDSPSPEMMERLAFTLQSRYCPK